MLFDQGEKTPEVGKKHGAVEWIAQPGHRRAARFHCTATREVYLKRFLKRSDVLVEIEELGCEQMFCGQPLGAPHSRVVVALTCVWGCPLRGLERPAPSSTTH